MADKQDMLANLAAMRAAEEISQDEFKAARERVLAGDQDNQVKGKLSGIAAGQPAPKPAKKAGCGTMIFGSLVLVVVLGVIFGDGKEQNATKSAEDKQKGFHCLSAWNGSSRDLIEYVKNNLRDPNSFEHVETKITPNKGGKHNVFMTFRAKNGFGGLNAGSAYGELSNVGCSLSNAFIAKS